MRPAETIRDTPLTFEEWSTLPEDQPGEWVEGWLVEEEMPSFVHEFVVGFLVQELGAWARGHGAIVLGSEWKMRVNADRGRKADTVVYLADDPRPRGRDTVAHTPPSVVIEVVTPTPRDARRDRVAKLDEYAVFGVRFYWIVDPQIRTLEIYERAGTRFTRVLGASEGSGVAIPGLEGLQLDLDHLWREVEALEAE